MPRKRRLKGDLPRLLSRHDGHRGVAYQRAGGALVRELGLKPGDTALLMQAGRCAQLWVEYVSASRDLDTARRARDAGRGRRPSAAAVDRLAYRAKQASDAYADALTALKADPLAQQRQAEAEQAALSARYRNKPNTKATQYNEIQYNEIKETTT